MIAMTMVLKLRTKLESFWWRGACDCDILLSLTKGVYREEGMQLTMYRTYSSNFVSETGYAKNRIQYTDVKRCYLRSYNYGRVLLISIYLERPVRHSNIPGSNTWTWITCRLYSYILDLLCRVL